MKTVPLVLLPGLLCDEALWQFQIKALKGMADCLVGDITRPDTISGLAAAALAKGPPKFALAGLSMGGYVALEIMRQAPERVTRLCLLDTSARPDTPEQMQKRRMFISMSRTGRFKGVTPRLLPLLIHSSRLKDEALTDIIFGMAGRIGPDAYIRQQTAIMNRADSRPMLSSIKCPVLVIVGRQDELTPPDVMREIASGVSGSHLEVIESCGHLSALEKPERVTELMKTWLAA